jgi:4-alpha-glucanotransferase
MGLSAFGENPYLISLEKLVDEGFLDQTDIENPPDFPKNRVDYGRAINYKIPLLAKSFEKFKEKSSTRYPEDFYTFSETSHEMGRSLISL